MNKEIYILVVDDNQENLRVVSSFLQEKDYKIALALNGKSALEILENNPIDLILLDIMMPEMDGFEVCRIIKKNKATSEIPLIFLSAKDQTEDIVQGFTIGAVDYITKPFHRDELLVRVKNHLDLYFAKKEIVEMNKTRDKLYSIVAHDIRTPFANIIQMLSIISDGTIEIGSSEYLEIIEILKQRSKDSYNFLNNLLQWTKIQSVNDMPDFRLVNISAIISDCVNLHIGAAQSKNIVVKIDLNEEIEVVCDEVTIHAVFRNLISNAIKFTPEGGIITCSVQEDDNSYTFSIEDSGVGIHEDLIKKIFEEQKIISTKGTSNESGSGLGLVLVKEFVAKNNGQFKIKNRTEGGLCASITLSK